MNVGKNFIKLKNIGKKNGIDGDGNKLVNLFGILKKERLIMYTYGELLKKAKASNSYSMEEWLKYFRYYSI